ncbi:conserved hypothetical protein [Ricinus communis]|uniref:diacylglycerol O-acyltransferase n=1 Tax=Ricinus communis TaxID=3988 RepID=B9RVX6_RICCO|nr:conserved hypothetical protein [Ricinus communis]
MRASAMMETEEEEVISEPVSPMGQYLSSSIVSLTIVAVLELEVPIDDSQAMSLLEDVFLPINPRFSSIMNECNLASGYEQQRRKALEEVEVKLENHVKVPFFPTGMSSNSNDDYLDDYLSKIPMEELPKHQPLWEVHIVKYQTTIAACNVIFKLHHSLGDGFTLMGALLSCLQRADNPSIPLSFPSAQLHTQTQGNTNNNIGRNIVTKILSSVCNILSDFCLRSGLIKDDKSPIKSGHPGVEFLPVSIVTMSFSLDYIKQIKTKHGAASSSTSSSFFLFLSFMKLKLCCFHSNNVSITLAFKHVRVSLWKKYLLDY